MQTELKSLQDKKLITLLQKPFVIKVTYKQGDKITVKKLVKKIQVEKKESCNKLYILHGSEGVKNKPFTDLIFNTKDIKSARTSFRRKINKLKLKITKFILYIQGYKNPKRKPTY